MNRKEYFSLFQKYGMDSKYQEPYFYEDANEFGFYYSLIHSDFGLLRRVFIVDNKEEADDFLYRLWWFKKNGEQFSVSFSFLNYENLKEKPIFMKNGKELNALDMKSLLLDTDYLNLQTRKKTRIQKLYRTCRILVKAIALKVKVQNDTYKSVLELSNEFKKQENEFFQLYNRYQKEQKVIQPVNLDFVESINLDSEIFQFNNQIEVFQTEEKKESELRPFIESLWSTLNSLESDSGHLQNKYLLIKYPIDLEDIRKKKSYMEYIINKRKGIFSKKEDFVSELKKIELDSEINKIVKMEDYIKNEVKRLEEKYSIIEEIDLVTLGDYINEFDNLEIYCPEDAKKVVLETFLKRDEVSEELKLQYSSLSKTKQSYLAVYHSFLQPICDVILKELQNEKEESFIEEKILFEFSALLYTMVLILNHPENASIRLKYFKQLSSTNMQKNLHELIRICSELLSFKSFSISGKCTAFGKNKKEGMEWNLYHASVFSTNAPVQELGQDEVLDICQFSRTIKFLYLPVQIRFKENYLDEQILEEVMVKEDILFLLKNCSIKYLNSDIIKVTRYIPEFNFHEGIKEVIHMKQEKTELYRIVLFEK